MAGSKETPRQRMIGMMYLVLTALLALNVSKDIINAFVKLDKKLLDNQQAILSKSESVMYELGLRMAVKEQKKVVEPYYRQAEKIRTEARKMENYILQCKNELIKAVEGEDWWAIPKDKSDRKSFKPLMEIETKDDYDAATRLFGGEEGTDGYEKGAELRRKIHEFRNWLCKTVAANKKGKKTYAFNSSRLVDPEFTEENTPEYKNFIKALNKSLGSVYSEERNRVKEMYMTLTLPKKINDFEETVDWQLGMFDHAPVVAAAAMFTSLQNDVLAAEAMALDLIESRVSTPPVYINKIEPMAFAPAAYLNMGDSMTIRVMTAAYDSNEVAQIKWSDVSHEDADSKKAGSNKIRINANTPGVHTMFGKIGVKQHGDVVWKPWSFKYEVGRPSAFASPLDMNVLYTYMDNRIAALASGYPTERVSLSAPGCTVKPQGNGEYLVIPAAGQVGTRIRLSVSGRDEKGNSRIIGTTEYRVRPLPTPAVYLGSVPMSKGRITRSELLGANSVTSGFDASIPITNMPFDVRSAKVVAIVNGNATAPKTITNGIIDQSVKALFRQCTPGSTLIFSEMRVYNKKGGQSNVGSFALIVQ